MVCFLVWLQFFVKIEILLDQTLTVIERESDLLGAHAELAALAHAIKVSEIAIDGLQAVMSLAGDLIGSFAFEVLAANDRLVSLATAEVMQGRAARDQLLLLALVGREHGSNLRIGAIEQLRQIDVTQERALGMSLFAEAQGFAAQALGSLRLTASQTT